jgi:hypothetical protein
MVASESPVLPQLTMFPIPNRIVAVQPLGGHLLRIRFRDEAEFDLDLLPHLAAESPSTLIDPLLPESEFSKVAIDYGTLVFPTGYDICPDVLRLWCERSKPLSKEETDPISLPD